LGSGEESEYRPFSYIDPHQYATSLVVFPSEGIATTAKEEICNVEMAQELRDAAVLIASGNPTIMLQ
jgi:hypothetical protein